MSQDGARITNQPLSENEKAIINQPPSASSINEKQKKLKSLNKMFDFLESASMMLMVFIYDLSFTSVFFLWLPDVVYGIPFYSYLLIFHSLLFLWLSIVHYQLFPRVIDKRYTISCEIEEQTSYQPAYHPSGKELIWCYLRILLVFVTNGGTWKFLSYMDYKDDVKNVEEGIERFLTFCGLEIVMVIVSIYVSSYIGPLYSKPEINNKTEEGKEERTENTDKRADPHIQNSPLEGEEVVVRDVDDFRKPREEVLEDDSSTSKLLQEKDSAIIELQDKEKNLMKLLLEKDKEINRLRNEKTEENDKNQ